MFGAGFVLINIALSLVVGLAFIGWMLKTGELRSVTEAAEIETALERYLAPITAVTAIPMTAACFGLCYLCRRFLDKRDWYSMGYRQPSINGWSGLVSGFIIGATPILLAALMVYLTGGFQLGGFGMELTTIIMIPTLFLMAFTEEILFRGYVLQNYVDQSQTQFGILVSSIIFWLVHALNPGVWSSPLIAINLFGAGIILAQAYLLSDNIWYPTVMHFAWNAVQGLLLSIPVSGLRLGGLIHLTLVPDFPAWLSGGDFGLEGSLIVTVLEAVLIASLAILLRSQPSPASETHAPPASESDETNSSLPE